MQDKIKANLDNEDFIKENDFYVDELYKILSQDEKTPQNKKGGV